MLHNFDLEGVKILIVDDNKINIDVLVSALEPENANLSIAQSGEEAIELAGKVHPDIILLDVMMGGIDGYETCRQIKKNDDLKDTPVIFITAKNEKEDIVEGFSSGGVDYIQKPFEFSEVIARVKTHYQNYQLKKEVAESNRQALAAHDELTRTQADLLRAERLSSSAKMITNFAHEIDNPSNFILNNLEGAKKTTEHLQGIIEQVIPDDEGGMRLKNLLQIQFDKIYEMMKLSTVGANRIIETVKGLREFSNQEKGYLREYPLSTLIAESLTGLTKTIKKVNFHSQIVDVQLLVNDRRFSQALAHLISFSLHNACQAKTKPKVELLSHTIENQLEIHLIDNGPVLSETEQQSLFEPLFYSKKLQKDSRIGLSLAYNIISNYEGNIKVTSRGNENLLIIEMPLAEEAKSA